MKLWTNGKDRPEIKVDNDGALYLDLEKYGKEIAQSIIDSGAFGKKSNLNNNSSEQK